MNEMAALTSDWWSPGDNSELCQSPVDILRAVRSVREPLTIVSVPDGTRAVATSGGVFSRATRPAAESLPLIGYLPAIYPEWLGDRSFCEVHGCRFAYVVGEMARGIATADMVIAAAEGGFMGFFGSAGLPVPEIGTAITRIQDRLGPAASNWGANLIHSPQDPDAERAVVDLFLARKVRRVSASAYMRMGPEIVRYMATGLKRDDQGRIQRENRIFGKVSRSEVAEQFMSPPPAVMLQKLVADGRLDAESAELASQLPVADDITAEADSGGHTDNRALTVLLPGLLALRDELTARYGYDRLIRVGAAGGLGSPAAVAAAFAAGASYVLTGSINQAAVESGLSEQGRRMLAEAESTDVAMAPAADMFELGVNVQVLKRGTLFAARGKRLYEIYRNFESLEAIPAETRTMLERDLFNASLDDVWSETRAYFEEKDPSEIERAEREPRRKMALVFRSYLFRGSQWARDGIADRRSDYQIWCGPAMGAFNVWVKGSYLESIENRSVVQIGRNLMEGATVITRAQQVRAAGVNVPVTAFQFPPRPLG